MSILVKKPSQIRKRFFVSPKIGLKMVRVAGFSRIRSMSFIRLPRIEDCFKANPQLIESHPNLKIGTPKPKLKFDDTLSRLSLWKTMFGEQEMPEIENGATEKYAGALDKYLPADFQFDKIIRRIRKGSN